MISDMTKGNPLKLILSSSVPMLIGNIFQQVYNFVDAAIVGKFVGARISCGGRFDRYDCRSYDLSYDGTYERCGNYYSAVFRFKKF